MIIKIEVKKLLYAMKKVCELNDNCSSCPLQEYCSRNSEYNSPYRLSIPDNMPIITLITKDDKRYPVNTALYLQVLKHMCNSRKECNDCCLCNACNKGIFMGIPDRWDVKAIDEINDDFILET